MKGPAVLLVLAAAGCSAVNVHKLRIYKGTDCNGTPDFTKEGEALYDDITKGACMTLGPDVSVKMPWVNLDDWAKQCRYGAQASLTVYPNSDCSNPGENSEHPMRPDTQCRTDTKTSTVSVKWEVTGITEYEFCNYITFRRRMNLEKEGLIAHEVNATCSRTKPAGAKHNLRTCRPPVCTETCCRQWDAAACKLTDRYEVSATACRYHKDDDRDKVELLYAEFSDSKCTKRTTAPENNLYNPITLGSCRIRTVDGVSAGRNVDFVKNSELKTEDMCQYVRINAMASEQGLGLLGWGKLITEAEFDKLEKDLPNMGRGTGGPDGPTNPGTNPDIGESSGCTLPALTLALVSAILCVVF